ncbi:MAG TPA: hypothetical protein VGP48_02550 [Stellaceae bacterium]|nr:hypothetical protein [Stellaceae bacterium]
MRASHAASLSAALLTTKGNAQPSRGLAEPISGIRHTFSALDALEALDPSPIVRSIAPLRPPAANATMPCRITLRVDEQLRLRLRLASAHLAKPRQVILLEALDHYLGKVLPAYLHDRCPCIEGGLGAGSACCQEDDT